MFSTKSSQSIKKLFAGYHEPLPLSKQQSQKLLDGLKTSFRAQLDREYGHSSSSPSTSASHPPPSLLKPVSSAPARRSAAHQHVKSILSNPLFGCDKMPQPPIIPSTPAPKRDPMDVFQHGVSKGMMTLRAATGCLIAKSQLVRASEGSVSSKETTQRVLGWLRSSGAENSLRFLDHEPFVNALVPFLVSAREEQVAWDWLTRTMSISSEKINDDQKTKRCSVLLSNIVRIKSQPAYGNLNAAISTILEAEQRFKDNALLPDILVQPWRSVSWLSTVEASNQPAPSEKLFDAHMAAASRLHQQVSVETAHLHLHHPTHPDYQPALRFFGDMRNLRKLLQELNVDKIDWKKSKELSVLPWITSLGHDTVERLVQTGHGQEAQSLSEMLQSELTSVLGDSLEPA